MPSSFKGLDLFASGPHRFSLERQGRRVVSLSAAAGDPSVPGTFESGDWDIRITVTGRLIADDEPDLWDLRDALTDEAAFEVTPGTLIDPHGREWEDIYLLSVEWDGPPVRARDHSIGYTATFGQLSAQP